jgi:hypothetical protein
MVAANKIAAGEGATACEGLIEADALAAASGQQLRLNYFAELPSIEKVEIVQDGTIRLKLLVETLASPPGDFGLEADVVLEDKITAEAEKSPTTKRLRGMIPGSARGRWSSYGTYAKGSINLLSVSKTGKGEK